ncbi:MAG TPA: PIN domain-containing protein [Bryobacteraceae bacterium]|nr:PIN domain-containing protein [Bryobacteraceae bacterium]HPT28355.1 PIN domain-containing protein [Bryobacteraceae bacterium]
MKVLADSNIILDVLLDRVPHIQDSQMIWAAFEDRLVRGYLSAHCITTVYYLLAKRSGRDRADELVADLLTMCSIALVDGAVLKQASEWQWPDFEDAVTASAALAANCDLIVTRDTSGFSRSAVKVMTPRSALAVMKRSPGRSRR